MRYKGLGAMLVVAGIEHRRLGRAISKEKSQG